MFLGSSPAAFLLKQPGLPASTHHVHKALASHVDWALTAAHLSAGDGVGDTGVGGGVGCASHVVIFFGSSPAALVLKQPGLPASTHQTQPLVPSHALWAFTTEHWSAVAATAKHIMAAIADGRLAHTIFAAYVSCVRFSLVELTKFSFCRCVALKGNKYSQ